MGHLPGVCGANNSGLKAGGRRRAASFIPCLQRNLEGQVLI